MLSKLKGIDIALYIFIMTVLGYLFTYLFQWGYNTYFSIPASFIDLSVTTITRSLALLGAFILIIIPYVLFFEEKHPVKSLFAKFFYVKVFESKVLNISTQIICLVGMIVFFIVWIKIDQPIKILYLCAGLSFTLGFFYFKKNVKMLVGIWLILMFLMPYMIGNYNAMHQKEFYIINNKTDYLVVDFYHDTAIAERYDKSKGTIYPELKFIQLDALSDYKKELKLVRINKLNVGNPQN